MQENLNLNDGSKVAIIGGGPAGSFFAHFLQKIADEKGLKLSITIFDAKDFLQSGPRGCNLCAGVIADSLSQRLQEEGIFLPDKRIINRVEGYCLHVNQDSIFLSCEENKKATIATVFRGNGPRYSTYPEIISFDDFLLSWVQDRGAELISQPVWDIKLPENKNDPVSLTFGKKENPHIFEADLAAGAFGVNTYLMNRIQGLGFGYKPPSTLITYQAELKCDQEEISRKFGNSIHVYLPKSKNIRYATIIPKGDYLTITLIGKKDASNETFDEFLSLKAIKDTIPSSKPQCFCYPRITVSPSKNPFTHRLVIIGDASFSRHYKNGIESAFITAKLAAEAALYYGIDSSSFLTHYYRQAKKSIIHDNYYGQLLFLMNDIISSIPLITQSHFSLTKTKNNASSKKLRLILWNMFTGNVSYKDIFKISLDFKLQTSLLYNTISLLFKRFKNSIKKINRHLIDDNAARSSKK